MREYENVNSVVKKREMDEMRGEDERERGGKQEGSRVRGGDRRGKSGLGKPWGVRSRSGE